MNNNIKNDIPQKNHRLKQFEEPVLLLYYKHKIVLANAQKNVVREIDKSMTDN